MIVSEFLVLSKPNLKKSTEFYIEKSIRDVVSIFETEFINRSIFYDVRIPKNKAIIRGNEDGMKQVFINVLKNSYEALEENGIITVNVTFQDETVSIFISDNGPGMDPETIENLFEPFYTTKTEGYWPRDAYYKKNHRRSRRNDDREEQKKSWNRTTIILPLYK